MASGAELAILLTAKDQTGGALANVSDKLGGFGKLGATAAVGLGAVAAGAGVLGAAAISAASDAQAATATIAAQTGLQGEALTAVADVAKNVYQNAFGESAASVAADVAKVRQAFGDLGSDQLQAVTQDALTLKDAFGFDVQETLRGTSTLTKQFGIDARQAFDITTAVMQKTGDPAGDLLDTFNEYSPLFRELGFSAEDFGAVLVRGAQNGARNYDQTADTLKEFNIRIRDGSKLTTDAFNALGINNDKFVADLKSGAMSGADALGLVTSRLEGIEDPIQRNTLGVALFGTKWEDMTEAGVLALGKIDGGLGTVEGATKRTGDALYDNFGARWTSVQRQAMGALVPIGAGLLGLADTVLKALAPAIEQIGPLIAGIGKAFAGETDFAAVLGPIGTVIDQIGGAFNALKNIFAAGDEAGGELQLATIINDLFGPEIAEKVVGFVQTVKTGLDDFMAKIGELTSAFEEGGLSGLLDSLFGEGTGAAVEELGKTIQEYVVPGFQMLGEAVTTVIGFFAEMFGLGVKGQLDGMASSGVGLKDVMGFLSDRIKNVGEAFVILGGLKDLVSIMAATLGQDFSNLGTRADELKTAVGQAFSDLGTAADTLKTNVGQAFSDLGTGAQTLLTNAGTAFSGIGTKAGELKTAVGNAFSDIGTAISTLASTIGTKASEIGTNLVQGIMNGISGKLGELRTMVQGWANALPDWMREKLGISSPSKVFMEIGGQVVDGLIVGLRQKHADVQLASGEIVTVAIEAIENGFRAVNLDLSGTANDLKFEIESIRDAYASHLDPLQESLDLLKEKTDYSRELGRLQNDLRLSELDAAKIAAMGDPVRQAELKAKLEALRLDEEGIRLQEQKAKLAEQAAKGKDVGAALARLKLDEEELRIKTELYGMVDRGELARIAREKAVIQAQNEQVKLSETQERLARQIAAVPIRQEMDRLKDAQAEQLNPLQSALKLIERALKALGLYEKGWKGVGINAESVAAAVATLLESMGGDGAKAGAALVTGMNQGITSKEPDAKTAVTKLSGAAAEATTTPAMQSTWSIVGGSWVKAITEGIKDASPGEKIAEAMRAGIGTVPKVKLESDFQWVSLGGSWIQQAIEGIKDAQPKLEAALRGSARWGVETYMQEVQKWWEQYKSTLPVLTPIATSGTFSGIPAVDNDPGIRGRPGAGYNGPGARTMAGTTVIVNGNVYGDRNLSTLLHGQARAAITQRTDAAVMRLRGVGAI